MRHSANNLGVRLEPVFVAPLYVVYRRRRSPYFSYVFVVFLSVRPYCDYVRNSKSSFSRRKGSAPYKSCTYFYTQSAYVLVVLYMMYIKANDSKWVMSLFHYNVQAFIFSVLLLVVVASSKDEAASAADSASTARHRAKRALDGLQKVVVARTWFSPIFCVTTVTMQS